MLIGLLSQLANGRALRDDAVLSICLSVRLSPVLIERQHTDARQ